MGLLTFSLTGTGFILIGSLESLRSSQTNKLNKNPSPFYITLSIFSSFIIFSSLTSLVNAVTSNDAVGSSLQLQTIPIALLFLFHSLLSLFFSLPSHLLNLILTFAFSQEFLLFYLQRKDPSGVENRYYDLLLVPIAVCVFSTLIELLGSESLSSSSVAKLGRGVGLILQGTWFIQMGLSLFYSSFVAQGCDLHLVSKGNYSLRCKGHSEYHRGRAIATLQFNCHLALMVVLFVGFYSFTCAKIGNSVNDTLRYKPIGGEMQSFDNSVGKFSLDSDDDNDEIKDANVENQKLSNGINGNHSNH